MRELDLIACPSLMGPFNTLLRVCWMNDSDGWGLHNASPDNVLGLCEAHLAELKEPA